jgi:hypothetical protein
MKALFCVVKLFRADEIIKSRPAAGFFFIAYFKGIVKRILTGVNT